MHKVTSLFSHIHVDCTCILAWFHMKTKFTWTHCHLSSPSCLQQLLLSSSAELQLSQRTGDSKIPSTVKIFNGPERRNSFSSLNTGPARRAELTVPAHLKPARKRRVQSCSHQHSTGIPYPLTAHTRGGRKWRELGASGEGRPSRELKVL